MANANTEQQILTKVQETLASTPYATASLTKLTGGTGNFLYHASLNDPQPDRVDGVVVKQGEGYVASRPEFPLSTTRCVSLPLPSVLPSRFLSCTPSLALLFTLIH